VDQVLEELDSSEAGMLKAAHNDIQAKEAALRCIHEHIPRHIPPL
jgi:hypothetical protein